MPDATTAIEWANKAGLVGVLVAILIAGNMGVWCWGTQLEEAVKRAEKWEALALKAVHVAESPGLIGMPPPDLSDLKADLERMTD